MSTPPTNERLRSALPAREWFQCVVIADADLLRVGAIIDRESATEAMIRKAAEGRLPPLRLDPPTMKQMSEKLLKAGWKLTRSNSRSSWWMPPDGGRLRRLRAAYTELRDIEIRGYASKGRYL
jgi:hypothetical protein